MSQKKYAISLKERISYALGDVGCNFVWSVVASFLTLYYTDSVGIAAATVGTILLVTRLLDGLTDLGFGLILDKTKTKMGKARPWILWSTPMMALGLIALFSVPDSLGDNGKVVYAFLTYVFVAAIAYTASNLSYNTLLALMTDDQPSKISANSLRFIFTSLFVIVMAYIVPPMVEKIGWSMMAVIFACLATLCFAVTFFGVKERNKAAMQPAVQGTDKSLGAVQSFKLLFSNRYFYTICIMFLAYYINASIFNGMGVYVCRDILHDINLYGTLNACYMGAKFVLLLFVPFLATRYGKWKLMISGWSIVILGMFIMWVGSENVYMVMCGAILRGVGLGPISACLFTIIADAVEYGEWKTGVNQAGLTNSATSSGMKVGTGLGSAIVGWGLALGDYTPDLAAQTDYTLMFEAGVFFLLPIGFFVIALIAMYFTNIDKIYPQIIKDLNERHAKQAAAKAEA